MRVLLLIATLFALPAIVSAQEDAGPARVRIHVERPPEGTLRRGVYPVPAWLVYLGGGLVVAGAAGVLVYRIARSTKR